MQSCDKLITLKINGDSHPLYKHIAETLDICNVMLDCPGQEFVEINFPISKTNVIKFMQLMTSYLYIDYTFDVKDSVEIYTFAVYIGVPILVINKMFRKMFKKHDTLSFLDMIDVNNDIHLSILDCILKSLEFNSLCDLECTRYQDCFDEDNLFYKLVYKIKALELSYGTQIKLISAIIMKKLSPDLKINCDDPIQALGEIDRIYDYFGVDSWDLVTDENDNLIGYRDVIKEKQFVYGKENSICKNMVNAIANNLLDYDNKFRF